MKFMHAIFHAICAGFFLVVSSCEENPQRSDASEKLLLEVYDPQSENYVAGVSRLGGSWDSAQVKVLLDGEFIGVTPIAFSAKTLQELELPLYRIVHARDSLPFPTWNMDSRNGFVVVASSPSERKRKIEFRNLNDDSKIGSFNFYADSYGSDGARLTVAIPKNMRVEDDLSSQERIPSALTLKKGVSVQVESNNEEKTVFLLLNNTNYAIYYRGLSITSPRRRFQVLSSDGGMTEELGWWCSDDLHLPKLLSKHRSRFEVKTTEQAFRIGIDFWFDDDIRNSQKVTVWSPIVENTGEQNAAAEPDRAGP